jgi:N-acetylneuraminic acid mutarotase
MFLRNPSEARLRGRVGIVAALVAGLALALSSAGCGGSANERSGAASASSWSFAARMLHRRSYTASAELGGKVYVAAGMVGNSGRPLDLFERFDPAKNEWSSLTPLPEKFSAGAATTLDGRIWVIGGNSETTNGRQVFAYDLQRGKWTEEPSLPAPRTNLAVVADGGKLYAIGGLDPVEATKTVFVYDSSTRHWSRAAPLPKPLQAHAAVVFDGEIWVLGGRVRSGTIQRGVWIYDPRTNRWRAGPPLPVPMETLGTSVSPGRIDAVLERNYFTYDATSKRWLRGPSLEAPRHALGVFTIDGTLYAIGGCVVPQLEDSSVVEKIALRRIGD